MTLNDNIGSSVSNVLLIIVEKVERKKEKNAFKTERL